MPALIDTVGLQLPLTVLAGWLDRREQEVLRYLVEENRVLRGQLRGRRLQLSDHGRRRLAARAYCLGRGRLREIPTIVTPDTVAAVASATHRSEVDVRQDEGQSLRRARRNPAASGPRGGGESGVGLHADQRRLPFQRGAPGPLHSRHPAPKPV